MSWVAVAKLEECKPGKAHIVNVNGREIGIIHEGDQYYAILNHCPHSGAPVCRGRVEGRVVRDESGSITYDHGARTLRCPWHHWEFDLASGRALVPIRERLKVYPVRVENDTVYVDV